jgi:hypothetical protein
MASTNRRWNSKKAAWPSNANDRESYSFLKGMLHGIKKNRQAA